MTLAPIASLTTMDTTDTIAALLITTIMLACFLRMKLFSGKKLALPPGPKPWPLVRNLPQFLKAKHKASWLSQILREFSAGIACIRIGNVHVITVSCPIIGLQILKKRDAEFASRPKTMASSLYSYGYSSTAFSPMGDQWMKMRKVLKTELLSPARDMLMQNTRMEESDHLVKWIYNIHLGGGPVNLRTVIRHYAANVSRRIIFGRRYIRNEAISNDFGPGPAEEEHVKAIWQSIQYLFSFAISDYFPFLAGFNLDGQETPVREAFDIFNKLHNPIIEERIQMWRQGNGKKDPEDFLDVLITVKDSNGKPLLSDVEIKGQIIELFMATTDNMAQCVEYAMAELINSPVLLEKAIEEVDRVVGKDRLVQESDAHNLNYLKACAREAFRLHPSAHFIISKYALADTTIAGYFIPKGSHIHLSRLDIGRNPSVWDDPLVFNPERHLEDASMMTGFYLTDPKLRFLTFSMGRRSCVAQKLASTLTLTLLARLVQGFSWKSAIIDLTESPNDLFMVKQPEAYATPRLPLHLYESL